VNYGNEEDVGTAIRRSALAREDVQVTTKIAGRHHAEPQATKSVEDSLRRLRMDYVDLCLIHWPNPRVGKYVEAWRALVKLRERGLVRSIGVSNFTRQHLQDVVDDTGVVPAVNQIELHPYFPQDAMRSVHAELGILTESWSPWASAAPLRPGTGGPGRRSPWDHPCSGDPALAPGARRAPASQVGHAGAAASEPRRVRVRARLVPRWPRSPVSADPTDGCSAATRTPTRRCERPTRGSSS
jgi:aryl-alcohol dehydrogenase-like predicted oxidoreductase